MQSRQVERRRPRDGPGDRGWTVRRRPLVSSFSRPRAKTWSRIRRGDRQAPDPDNDAFIDRWSAPRRRRRDCENYCMSVSRRKRLFPGKNHVDVRCKNGAAMANVGLLRGGCAEAARPRDARAVAMPFRFPCRVVFSFIARVEVGNVIVRYKANTPLHLLALYPVYSFDGHRSRMAAVTSSGNLPRP